MRHRQTNKNEKAVSPVIGVILMVAITVILAAVIGTFVLGLGDQVQETPTAGIDVEEDSGQLTLTIVNSGNIESAQLLSPSGTRSTVLDEGLEVGAKLTIRSNGTVNTFLQNRNVSIIDAGTEQPKQINDTSDIPSKNLILQEFDSAGNDYTQRTAYLACVFNHGGFEVGGESVPSSVSIPCHTPVLAEASDDVTRGTTGQSPGSTVPILLEEGEYSLLGQVGGDKSVIRSVEYEEG